jgi:phosphate transport system permease protein
VNQLKDWPETLPRRHLAGKLFAAALVPCTLMGVLLLAFLLIEIARHGLHWLDWQFITSFPSRKPEQAGILAALVGSLWIISLTALISVPLGIGAAIYLQEYPRKDKLSTLIEVNIANLAGVPSIVYGMLGLTMFVRWLNLGRSILTGALILSLLILPVVIVASREALKAVPLSIRQAAVALGATRWQTVRHHVLPLAMPGILTGIILALSRAIGETAPLIMVGALTYVAFTPSGPMDAFTALPIQVFNWASRPQPEFHELAAAGIIVLLGVLLSMNALAILIRYRSQRSAKW